MIKKKVTKVLLYVFEVFSEMLSQKVHRDGIIIDFQKINYEERKSIINQGQRSEKLIISLTSFSSRVRDVYLTIESLGRQSILADKIILWLSEDEFDDASLPSTLLRLQKRGLTIRFCKDIKSYKKLIPALEDHYNDIIITVDDDIIYDFNLIELLYTEYQNNPNCICCMSGKLIGHDKGVLTEYRKWQYPVDNLGPSHEIIGVGFGGILYFPGCFMEDISNEQLFMELAPKADDIWFKIMAYMKDTKYKIVEHKNPSYKNIVLQSSDFKSLAQHNVIGSYNDKQFRNVLNHYEINENVIVGK